eukprot:CAMPEP_0179971674 /NCGR_PEP_ID=MMETSP0983-20121128/36167_1 /TAXON_ID=483367 /ORGANISM="non described non described, Strain CCMP 2436" /LENGTH=314 /DNA_ID=CAMNT_0021886841 /DNA_START=323 /DNA_END=1264 /DNA_ORIENTATION=-
MIIVPTLIILTLARLATEQHIIQYINEAGFGLAVYIIQGARSADMGSLAVELSDLLAIAPALRAALGEEWPRLLAASQDRTGEGDGARLVCFDAANGFALASPELLNATGRADDVRVPPAVTYPPLLKEELEALGAAMADDVRTALLALLALPRPPLFKTSEGSEAVQEQGLLGLTHIELDVGRAPVCWLNGRSVPLSNEVSSDVSKEEPLGADGGHTRADDSPKHASHKVLARTVSAAELERYSTMVGGFGEGGRFAAAAPSSLHVAVALRASPESELRGVTVKLAANARGEAGGLLDLLYGGGLQRPGGRDE